MLRERVEVSKGGRRLLEGRRGESLDTLETEGQMLQRVMPDLMSMKNVLVMNDEGHHCYREKQTKDEEGKLSRDDQAEGKKNRRRRPCLDHGARNGQAQARRQPGDRPVSHAVLSQRFRLPRGHSVPLDSVRLLSDGRDRVRDRQAAARAGIRQYPRRRDADVSQPVGAHW